MAKKVERPPNPVLEYALERLSPHGPIRSRFMFGGYGIFYHNAMFACIVDDVLFFRVDEGNRKDYAPYKAVPFQYPMKGKLVTLPYLSLPKEILDDSKELPKWIEKARQASMRSKTRSKSKTKKS